MLRRSERYRRIAAYLEQIGDFGQARAYRRLADFPCLDDPNSLLGVLC
jgi:hypothetical protein